MATTAGVWAKASSELGIWFPKRNEQVHGTVMDGESVLLDLSTGRYYTLNVVGSTIWDHCTGDRSLEEILATVCDKFDVPAAQAQDDLTDLMAQLSQEGLIHIERR